MGFEITDERGKKKDGEPEEAAEETSAEASEEEVEEKSNEELKVEIQDLLDTELNPAVAMHGGYIGVLDVKGSTVYIQMAGGCQGCGMASVTLKQGVEAVIAENFPQIDEILDTTEHAAGTNPYYAPSAK